MANTKKARPEGEFRHGTSFGKRGELLYDAPIEILGAEDLALFGITWEDCRFLNYGGQRLRVYFFPTANRAFAEDQWRYLSTRHSAEYAAGRCMVPGVRRAFKRCPDRNSCARCPYGRSPDQKQPPVISLNSLLEDGFDVPSDQSAEAPALSKLEYEALRARMDAEDPRIAAALELRVLGGWRVQEIANALGISGPRVYQLIERAREIGEEYRRDASGDMR